MSSSCYKLTLPNLARFAWKHVVRLDPPYFATIALALLIGWLASRTPGYRGVPFHVNLLQLLSHVGYLNGFTGFPWLVSAFWTLAIECQFYLLIAVAFPLFVSRKRAVRLTASGIALLMPLLYHPAAPYFEIPLVLYFLPLFVCGIAAFQRFAGIANGRETGFVLAFVAAMLYVRMGIPETLVGLASAGLILLAPGWSNRTLAFLGSISYSLYLVPAFNLCALTKTCGNQNR